MSRYGDQVRDEYGRSVPGVSIYVYVWDADAQTAGGLDTLTDDLSTPLANPLTSDADGLYYFNAIDGQKLIEYHYGGKVEFRDLIQVGPVPVPQATFGGLLANAAALTIPTGMDLISTTGADALDHGGATYVAGTKPTTRSGFTSANSRNFVLSKEQVITPQMFYQATDPDFQNAMEGMRDYLNTFTLNAGGSGFYNGAPKAVCPAAPTYLMHDRVDFFHTGTIEGEGDGWFGPGAGGCTHFKWTGNTSGFGVQSPNTSDLTTVDVTTHNGSGGLNLRDMCLEGGYVATEGDYHGLVLRNGVKATDLYIKNWPGENVHAWAGNVIGFGNVGGNLSTTRLIGIKGEGSRGNIDIRGSDANLIITINCESYQNRQFGLIDDNGAGSNKHLGMHNASNGMISSAAGPYTQCSSGGNRYGTRYGGTYTNAPSGTTAHTADWIYIEAGGTLANLIPAHAATPGLFRFGSDMATINSAGVNVDDCYSEGGTLNQFNATTKVDGGTIGQQYIFVSHRIVATSEGLRYLNNTGGAAEFNIQTGGTEAAFRGMDLAGTAYGYVDFIKGAGTYYLAPVTTGHNYRVGTVGSYVNPVNITTSGVEVQSGFSIYNNGVKVLGARQTGWTADTGTAKRTANASYTAGAGLTFSAGYVQAELTAVGTRLAAIETALQNTTQTQKAVKDDLITQGVIGA